MKKVILIIAVSLCFTACSKGFRVSFGVTPVSSINESQYFNDKEKR